MRPDEGCEHVRALTAPAEPRADRCEECGVHHGLRACLECGHVGRCDSASGHARDHAKACGHPLIRAHRRGAFVYCYEHGYL